MPIPGINYLKIKRPLRQNKCITNLFGVTRIGMQYVAQKVLMLFRIAGDPI